MTNIYTKLNNRNNLFFILKPTFCLSPNCDWPYFEPFSNTQCEDSLSLSSLSLSVAATSLSVSETRSFLRGRKLTRPPYAVTHMHMLLICDMCTYCIDTSDWIGITMPSPRLSFRQTVHSSVCHQQPAPVSIPE